MIVNTLIKPSAQMAVVTEIAVGDIFKRLDTTGYGGTKIVLGLVTDVMQNGEKTAVTAIEFTPPEYSTQAVEPRMVTFDGEADVAIYPVKKDEFAEMMRVMETAQANTVEAAERDLARKQGVLARIRSLQAAGITEASTRVLTA